MKLKIALAVLLILLILGGLVGIKALQIGRMISAGASFAMPPEAVTSAIAREETWPVVLSAIGSISAAQGVNVTPEVSGTVAEIRFESGARVAQGDLLVRLDTSAEEAQLRAAEAQVDLARINLDRARKLRSESTVSQSELDSADSTHKQAVANADLIRATIAKKTIRAPFAGRLGIRDIDLGEFLGPGKTIVSLQALTSVYADFTLPQQELAKLAPGMDVRVVSDSYPGKEFAGKLTAINPDLDAGTRSVRLQATLDNPGELLRPGMFARVELLLPEKRKVLAVPATAILSAPYGDSVYVIEAGTAADAVGKAPPPALVVRQAFVKTSISRGDFLAVESGLKPGDRVVSTGTFKLRNKMAVIIRDDLAPENKRKPQPGDS